MIESISGEDWSYAAELIGTLRIGRETNFGYRYPEKDEQSSAVSLMISWGLRDLRIESNLSNARFGRLATEALYPRVVLLAPDSSFEELFKLISMVVRDYEVSELVVYPDGVTLATVMALACALFWYDETFERFEEFLRTQGWVQSHQSAAENS